MRIVPRGSTHHVRAHVGRETSTAHMEVTVVFIVPGLLVVAGVIWWVRRAAEPPIMRQRVNAGSDRYFAERDRPEGSDGGDAWDGDDGDDD